MLKIIASVGMAAAVTGCSGLELARLAPPGIIRYERIADEKEPNPTIVERVAERRETIDPEFPKLGETAAGGATRSAIPNESVDAQIARLESRRDNLGAAVETDLVETGAAVQETQDIEAAVQGLSKAIDDEKKAAARERREAEAYDANDEK